MKQVMTVVALLMTLLLKAQSPWEKIEVNEHLNISFPSKPLVNRGKGQQSYILKLADSTANLIVAVTDLQKLMGIDSATLAATMENEESWQQAKTAFLGSMGTDASLEKEEMLLFHNTKAMRMIVNRKTEKGNNVLTVLIFVQGTNSINAIFNSRGGKGDEKTKEQFFGAIELK